MASRKRNYFVMTSVLMLALTGCGQVTSRVPLLRNLQARSQARASQRQQAQHVADGNAAYVEGDLDSAETHYQDALDLNSTLAVALHNQGNVDYRNALWDDATAHYEDALEHHQPHPDTNPWTASHYNLGNIAYQSSQQAEADPTSLSAAIEHYKDALRQDPTDEDAKYNLELALRQQADQPPPDEQPQDDSEDNEDQQEQQDNETPPEDGEPQDDEGEPQDGDSQDNNQQDGDTPQDDGDEQPSESQDGDEQEDDADEQEDDTDTQEGEEDEDAKPQESEDDSDSSAGSEQDSSAGAQQPLVMTPAQAAQLLEAAVGQSETLQAYLQQATSPLPPPEQDW
ncbi:MAG: hypothetical protein AAF267_02085 [Deinococcota bacterium]